MCLFIHRLCGWTDGLGWVGWMGWLSLVVGGLRAPSVPISNKVNSTLRNSVKMNSHMSDADGGQACKLKDENQGLLPESNMMHQKYKVEPHQVRLPKQPINCSKHTGEN